MAFLLLSQVADFGARKATPCIHRINSIAENPKPSELEPKGVQRSTSERAKAAFTDPELKPLNRLTRP
jgi:hypothetical protein